MSRCVLFVDDDSNLLSGLKRSIRSFVKDWEIHFAGSALEALDLLEKHSIDVLVTDIQMPGMDGIQLLNVVIERFPQVVRLVLSGQIAQEISLKSTQVAHQFIAKPCDTQKLVQTIKNLLQMRELQNNQQLVSIITSIKQLPSLPSLYLKLVNEIESPDASAKTLTDIISQDITMTAKVLQLVNTAFYGLPAKVTNLQLAVTILGTNTLKALVLTEGVFSQYRGSEKSRGLSMDELWKHSIEVGSLARTIARTLGLGSEAQDDAQVGGVMHDIGKLIAVDIPDFYPSWQEKVTQGVSPLAAEISLLGTSHAELGAYLLGIWGLPASIVQAVAYHHYPAKSEEQEILPLSAIHVANGIINDQSQGKLVGLSIDKAYLKSLNLADRLESWIKHYQTMKENEQLVE